MNICGIYDCLITLCEWYVGNIPVYAYRLEFHVEFTLSI